MIEVMQQSRRSILMARAIELVERSGLIRVRDAEKAGIPREYILRLYRDGSLVRIGRGVYALPESHASSEIALAEISKKVPGAVICLMSALRFHEITTQLPYKTWIAIPAGQWKPAFSSPPVEVVRLSKNSMVYGVEVHSVSKVIVRIFSAAKTVADCFKFRSKVGLDIAIEALRETINERRATPDEIWEAARVDRVSGVIRPYLEAIV